MVEKMMVDHIHILGASGSGTSTLGDTLARSFEYVHLDTDGYFWEPTTPPFQQTRGRQRRQALLCAALDTHPRWVLSGSLCGWGDIFIPCFDLVIFLFVPQEIRMARLKAREERRFGQEALAPGGALHASHMAFMTWAAAYDEGGDDMRSRRRQEQWLAALPCPCIRLEGLLTVEEQMTQLEKVLAGGAVGFSPGAI
jgi:adenylate kinase family enzyme